MWKEAVVPESKYCPDICFEENHETASTLKMEAMHSSETSVHTRSIGCHIPEDGIFRILQLRIVDISVKIGIRYLLNKS
jgi:hypothetical protein